MYQNFSITFGSMMVNSSIPIYYIVHEASLYSIDFLFHISNKSVLSLYNSCEVNLLSSI